MTAVLQKTVLQGRRPPTPSPCGMRTTSPVISSRAVRGFTTAPRRGSCPACALAAFCASSPKRSGRTPARRPPGPRGKLPTLAETTMASVYKRQNRWYVRYRDAQGRWRSRTSTARTKTEAIRLAGELERRCERQRLGLEPLPPQDGGGTLDDLLGWWLKTYSKGAPSHQRNEYSVRKNLIGSALGALRLVEVVPAEIEKFSQARSSDLGPQTINHLRGFLVRTFNRAIHAGKWTGSNPALAVEKRKVPRRKPDYLRAYEVPLVLVALHPRWRALFATAIYTGMRRGELLGLLKTDVDFASRLITITRSHTRDVTKGGHADAIPISDELLPYLRAAVKTSPSELVFPKADGSRMRPDVALEGVLRRALARAGIVLGYRHVCRAEGCGHVQAAADAALRRCPTHKFKLWPKAVVRPIRFHDLRHTTGSLLMMAGVNPAAVQRILRHHDPRITTEIYGHLEPGYLRNEINSLRFGAALVTASDEAMPVAEVAPLVTPLLQDPQNWVWSYQLVPNDLLEIAGDLWARHRGFEPLTYGSGG